MSKKISLICALILLIASFSNADVPQLINYQGWLTDGNGNPVTATVSIQFKIYDSETNGNMLWLETQSVDVVDGVFSVLLGSASQIPYSVFNGADRYFALQVGNDSEMTPRKRLVSVGYAYRAYDADKVDGKDAVDFVQTGQANSITTNMIQNDAVTSAKILPDFVSSVNGVKNDGGNIDLAAGNNISINADDANNTITISATGSGGGDNDWTISGNDMYSAVSGGVSIGTTVPHDGKLVVANSATDEAYISLQPGGDANNDIVGLRASHSGNNTTKLHFGSEFSNSYVFTDMVTIDGATSFVGIGTTTPGAKLHIYDSDPVLIVSSQSSSPSGRGSAILQLERGGSGKDRGLVMYSNGQAPKWHTGFLYNYGQSTPNFHISQENFISDGSTVHIPELTITTESKVGIGTFGPESKLHVIWDSHSLGTIRGDANGQYGRGVYGVANGISGKGVYGFGAGSSADGVYGGATGFWSRGVVGEATGEYGMGVLGIAGGKNAYAGKFEGRVFVTGDFRCNGTLSKGGGSFMIDHPLDPENKYLYHSFVESPDMMNIYNGNIVTDGSGYARVKLPEWFEALNKDFRYQLTVIGEFAQAIVYEKISNNHFSIKTDKPNVEVSWQVTGIRQDAFANANRIPVEKTKEENDRGKYLHPEAFNFPKSAGIYYDEKMEQDRIRMEEKK